MTAPTEKAAPIPALMPCPFCGGRAETWVLEHPEIQGGEDCQYQGGCAVACAETPWCDTIEEVAEWWNRRADREARPSLPDSREEPGYLVRIAFREGRSSGLRITSPDVPGLILSHHDEPAILADMVQVLREAARARARQGGNNG